MRGTGSLDELSEQTLLIVCRRVEGSSFFFRSQSFYTMFFSWTLSVENGLHDELRK